ncbi:unnamed protein product [Ectocarpus sp. CCAP 1310/34]|nr:unnamed protein product [Ectocarpus sp. CCAP 1310/34]
MSLPVEPRPKSEGARVESEGLSPSRGCRRRWSLGRKDAAAGGASAEVGGGEGGVGGSKPKQRMPPPVEPRPPPESTRAEPVMPKPSQRTRRGRAEGCTEERLSRRPAARSVVYRRAFEGGAGTGGGSVKIDLWRPSLRRRGRGWGRPSPSRGGGGRAAGRMEERPPRRPVVRSVVYWRALEGGAGTRGGSLEIEEEATRGAPAEVIGGEGGVGQAQAEEGAGGGQHGGEASAEARGQRRALREDF